MYVLCVLCERERVCGCMRTHTYPSSLSLSLSLSLACAREFVHKAYRRRGSLLEAEASEIIDLTTESGKMGRVNARPITSYFAPMGDGRGKYTRAQHARRTRIAQSPVEETYGTRCRRNGRGLYDITPVTRSN